MNAKRTTRLMTGLLAATLSTFALSAPAFAAAGPSNDNTVVIRKVDTSQPGTVGLTVLKPPVAANSDQVKITQNGSVINDADVQTAAQAKLPMDVVLVMDTSATTQNGDILNQEKKAAAAMISARTENESFAVIATNGTPRTVSPFSNDGDALIATINGLQASNQNALWSGVAMGSALLDNDGGLQHNMVILAGSPDQTSADGAFASDKNSLQANKSVVFGVGIGTNVDTADLKSLASTSGGRFIGTSDSSTTPEILTGIEQNLADQAVISYASTSTSAIDIAVSVGTGTATAHASPNTVSEGVDVLPTVVPKNAGPSFLSGPIGLILIAVVALAATGLLLYGIIEIVSRESGGLTSALRPYSDEPDDHRDISRLGDSDIIKKAVAATAKAAEERGLLQIVERRLEQADLPFRPAEALFMVVIVAFVAMFIGAIFFKLFGIVIAALIFGVAPLWITGFMGKRRRNKFTRQLPDTLQLLAGSLRAGYSLVQGLDAVSKQSDSPMGPELIRAMSEARLGRPVEEALQEMSDRMGSDDFEWAVMAIKIQREVGGNLAELLMTVSETMVARERLRREVRALTAEGRISAIVLAGLPPVIGLVITMINPGYMSPMLHNFLGQIALGGGAVMIVIGYWLMMKMIQVEA